MLSNKSLMYGLGIGLMIGSALLQMMHGIERTSAGGSDGQTPVPAVQELDRQQLKSMAAKYFKVYEKDEKVYSQAEADGLVQQKLSEERAKQPPASAAPASTRDTYIYVSKGLNSSQVADMLYQSGIITDRKAFEDQMNAQQLNSRIVTGIHAFKGAGPHELSKVISQITTQ